MNYSRRLPMITIEHDKGSITKRFEAYPPVQPLNCYGSIRKLTDSFSRKDVDRVWRGFAWYKAKHRWVNLGLAASTAPGNSDLVRQSFEPAVKGVRCRRKRMGNERE